MCIFSISCSVPSWCHAKLTLLCALVAGGVPDQGDAGQEPRQAAYLHGRGDEDDRVQGQDGVLRRHGVRQLLRRRAARRRHARQQAPLRCVQLLRSSLRCLKWKRLAISLMYICVLCTQALEYSHVCKYACSEEVPELQDMGGPIEGNATFSFFFLFFFD
jgi:hypothetical protein